MQFMRSDTVDWPKLAGRLFNIRAELDLSFLGMKFIETLFKGIPDATIDVRAVQLDLSMALWFSRKKPLGINDLPRTPYMLMWMRHV